MSDVDTNEVEEIEDAENLEVVEEGEVLQGEMEVSEKKSKSDSAAMDVSDANLDKVEEYFRQKDIARTLRNDLKDIKLQMEEVEELEKLTKRIKELREKVKENETIRTLTEKIQNAKERMELLKELIRIELLETSQEEVKRNGRKLKIVNILREMKDEGDKKKKPAKQFFRN